MTTSYELTISVLRPDQLKAEIASGLPTVTDVGFANGTADATGLIWSNPAKVWATFSADLSAADQQTLAGIVAAHKPVESVDDKLAAIQQIEKTLAAVVRALAVVKANNPNVFNGLPTWAVNQLTAAEQWIVGQGG